MWTSTGRSTRMNARITQLAALLVAAAALLVATWLPGGAGAGPTPVPLAGPWYTPHELEALKAFSTLSFTEKQAYLAALDPSTP